MLDRTAEILLSILASSSSLMIPASLVADSFPSEVLFFDWSRRFRGEEVSRAEEPVVGNDDRDFDTDDTLANGSLIACKQI
jgi:hypothetical protein